MADGGCKHACCSVVCLAPSWLKGPVRRRSNMSVFRVPEMSDFHIIHNAVIPDTDPPSTSTTRSRNSTEQVGSSGCLAEQSPLTELLQRLAVWLQTEDRYDLVRGRLALPTPLNPMTPRSLCHEPRYLTSRFVFDVYCPYCLTLFHTRQGVFSHLVDGQRRCLYTLAVSVEPAPDALAQQLLDQDRRVRKVSKHLSLEWHPKHLPAIRMHGPLQSWAHRLGRWSSP